MLWSYEDPLYRSELRNSWSPSGTWLESSCWHQTKHLLSSSLRTRLAFSRSAIMSSRYWYLSFFLALHSRALCLLFSSFTTFISPEAPRTPGSSLNQGCLFFCLSPHLFGDKNIYFWMDLRKIWLRAYEKGEKGRKNKEGKGRNKGEEIFFGEKKLEKGGGIWISKLIFTPTFNCSGGEPVKMSSKSKLGLEMSILWGLSSVNICREWRQTFSRTPQIQINYLWKEMG